MISHSTPGAPTIDLPVPDGWKVLPESSDAPYGGIAFNTPTDPNDPPKIIGIVEKLTGNVNGDTLLSYAPGEVKNLSGDDGGDGEKSTLGGFPAYQLGGDYTKDGMQREVAQKTRRPRHLEVRMPVKQTRVIGPMVPTQSAMVIASDVTHSSGILRGGLIPTATAAQAVLPERAA